MLVDLQAYQEVFEIKFLHETEATYRAEALSMMRDPEFTVSLRARALRRLRSECLHTFCISNSCQTICPMSTNVCLRKMTACSTTYTRRQGEWTTSLLCNYFISCKVLRSCLDPRAENLSSFVLRSSWLGSTKRKYSRKVTYSIPGCR